MSKCKLPQTTLLFPPPCPPVHTSSESGGRSWSNSVDNCYFTTCTDWGGGWFPFVAEGRLAASWPCLLLVLWLWDICLLRAEVVTLKPPANSWRQGLLAFHSGLMSVAWTVFKRGVRKNWVWLLFKAIDNLVVCVPCYWSLPRCELIRFVWFLHGNAGCIRVRSGAWEVSVGRLAVNEDVTVWERRELEVNSMEIQIYFIGLSSKFVLTADINLWRL
jgi:hypothetical protein